jgi:glycosyltransferase involved in cell wall biosynthesis
MPPGLAIISNCVTPYRVNLHKLIAAGIPELKLHTLITHGDADFKWAVDVPASVSLRHFGCGDDSPLASPWRAPLREWRKGGRLIEYLRSNNIRAVVCNGYRYISYYRVIRYCHRAGLPLFVRSDSNIQNERALSPIKRWFKARVYNWWLHRVSGVMSMGKWGDEFFLQYGAVPSQLYRVPYTPDYDYFAAVNADRLDRFRRKVGLRDGRRYVLFCGRLVRVKRVDLLIDAFAGIAAQRPEWDLLIVGDGILGDDLRHRVPEHLRPRVAWAGFLEGEESALAYHAADVLAVPSDMEPWGLVVQEAMAAGLVVVASDVVGAANELVEDRWSGRIFPAGDLGGLRQAILDVTQAGQTSTYQQHSRESLQTWRQNLSPVSEIRRALADAGILPSGTAVA